MDAHPAIVVLLHVPPGVPEAWVQGVADLLAMARPASCPAARWETLREDSYRFLRDWAARAHRLGWTTLDLFRINRNAPLARLDHRGLVPSLQGHEIEALAKTRATIKAASGGRLVYHRSEARRSDETCLLWELGNARS